MTPRADLGSPVRASPTWVGWLAALLVAGSFSQLAYALHPRKGPFIGYVEVAAVGMLLVWGTWVLASGRLRFLCWPPWPAWALVAMACLSLAEAVNVKAGIVEVAQYALYFLALYVFFADAFAGRPWLAVKAFLAGTGVAGGLALGQLFRGAPPMAVHGLASDRNVHSALLTVVLPLLWVPACLHWPRRRYWVGATGIALAAVTMLGPPHVWVALIGIAWVAGVVAGTNWWKAVLPLGGLVLLVNFVSPVHRACNVDEFMNPWETGNVYKLLRDTGAAEGTALVKKRWLEWYPALAMIADRPLLGVGAGNYQLNIGRAEYWGYLPNAKKTEPNTNNLYLVTGGSLGVPGLASLVALLTYHLGLARRRAESGDPLAVGVTASLAVLAVVNLFTALLVRGAAVGWTALFVLAALSGRQARGESGHDAVALSPEGR
ncbi:MAG: O-antigen ligase family protein [Armatimonadetes bacterium]|nr:O-antigen ligase family protein [Armatimonadota bacterium]